MGLETPSPESLQECHKLQNKGRDLVQTVQSIQRAGLEVMGGFIVGFDSDRQDIFKQQFDFIQRSGVVTAMVGLLSALPQTRLYQRLKKEGRLEADSTGNNTEAVLNFKPKLNREFLQSGYRDLMKKLYEPKAYYQRIRIFLRNHRPQGAAAPGFPGGLSGLLEIILAPGHLGPWPPQLLALLLEHVVAPARPASLRHRAGRHRLPLPPRGQPAVNSSLRRAANPPRMVMISICILRRRAERCSTG